jgi:hypothetical protein
MGASRRLRSGQIEGPIDPRKVDIPEHPRDPLTIRDDGQQLPLSCPATPPATLLPSVTFPEHRVLKHRPGVDGRADRPIEALEAKE